MVNEVGQRLRDLRLEVGMGIRELERRSRISRSEISRIERGQRNPYYSTLVCLAQSLGSPVERLTGELVGPGLPKPSPEVQEFSRLPQGAQRALLDIVPLLERVKKQKV